MMAANNGERVLTILVKALLIVAGLNIGLGYLAEGLETGSNWPWVKLGSLVVCAVLFIAHVRFRAWFDFGEDS